MHLFPNAAAKVAGFGRRTHGADGLPGEDHGPSAVQPEGAWLDRSPPISDRWRSVTVTSASQRTRTARAKLHSVIRLDTASDGPQEFLINRSPATASPAEDPKLKSSATRTAGVHLSGRRITGSASCPRTAAMPMPVHRRAGQRGPPVPPAFLAATKAAKGIGQGAAMPAPHPTTSPAGTESGSLRPSASVGNCSRIATTLANPTAPANPRAATRSAVFSVTPAMTSSVTWGVA